MQLLWPLLRPLVPCWSTLPRQLLTGSGWGRRGTIADVPWGRIDRGGHGTVGW